MSATGLERGLIISFDGLDSSGKNTQTKHLTDRLRYLGYPVRLFQSPDYTTESGKQLKLRLQHKLGDWHNTPWQEKMKYFAQNRAEHRTEVLEALRNKEIVMYDRYVPSSLAFMAVEALEPQMGDMFRRDVYAAVEREEYEANKMPREDVSIFLDVHPKIASVLLEKRKEITSDEDEYTDHISVQERLYNEYDFMCNEDSTRFLRIACVVGNELLGIEDTAELIWEGLITRFPFLGK